MLRRSSAYMRSILLGALVFTHACAARQPTAAGSSQLLRPGAELAPSFLRHLVRAWPPQEGSLCLAVSSPHGERVSSYDNALLALYLVHHQQRSQAGSILAALSLLQAPDGSLPFSFAWPSPDPSTPYVRSGAIAWVGYAATEYLNAERDGTERERITRLAHQLAEYLLAHQVAKAGDPRDGLVLGGSGSFRLELEHGAIRERYLPGEVDWASTEHNIDAFFFLRDFSRLTDNARFAQAAERIEAALLARGLVAAQGQFARGFQAGGLDEASALDCASWGALFLLAAGDETRAETSLAAADFRYAAHDPQSGALGHRPYAHAQVIENIELAEHLGNRLPARNWDEVDGVWSEGSAGVALAALRLGHRQRAEQILDQLEKLRTPDGGLPTFTVEIPSELDTSPSLAGTVWVELLREELAADTGAQVLWRTH